MKKLIIIFIVLNFSFSLNAQNEFRSLSFFSKTHSKKEVTVAYFMDGTLCSSSFIRTVNEKFIDTYSVQKKKIAIEGKEYDEQVYFTSKKDYNPKFIKISEVKIKYAINQNLPCFYFIDGVPTIIDNVESNLDEDNVLEISCHVYNNVSENLKINCIEIFTKTKQNLERANTKIMN